MLKTRCIQSIEQISTWEVFLNQKEDLLQDKFTPEFVPESL